MSALRPSITSEELAALEIRRYPGPIVMVETAADLDALLADAREEKVVGFDTETRPAFRPGETYDPCLAQLATSHAAYLLPLQRLDCAAALGELLARANLAKAGVSLADDLRKLKGLFAFEENGIVDLGVAARRAGVRQTGVRNLAGLFLGFRIPKGKSTSNWAARHLTPQQILYAATDAWACRELYLRFQALGLLEACPGVA